MLPFLETQLESCFLHRVALSIIVIASQPDSMGNVKQEQSFKVVLYYDKPGGFMFLSRLIIEFRLPPKGGMTLVRVFSN